jgi:hypothetical protein
MRELIPMIDADTNAFNDYMAALGMPKETSEQKTAREQAMQDGLKKAIDIPLTNPPATQSSVSSIPVGAIVVRCDVTITSGLPPGATISVGQAGTPSAFQATTDNNPQNDATYTLPQRTPAASTNPVLVTVGGAPVAGQGFVTVLYSMALN